MTNKASILTLKELFFHNNQDPSHNAIESPGYEPLTYQELRNQITYVVKTLNAKGFSRNDRIAVITPGGPETAVLMISVMAGFTAAPLNPEYKEQEFDTYFSKLKIKAIIVEKGCETTARAVAATRNIPVIEVTPKNDKAGIFTLGPIPFREVDEAVFASPSDIAILLQTSGTTSIPKIVPLSQKQLCASAQVYCSLFGLGSLDRSLHIVPYYHLLGILGAFLPSLTGGGTVICTKNFIPSDFFHLLKTYRPTYYVAGPAHHRAILSEIRKIPPDELKNNSLRIIRSTSAALPITVLQEIETLLGVSLIESYAMTESPYISVNFPYKAGSVGIPMNISLIITDENGNSLKAFEPGEIVIRGEGVFSGYEDAPDENAFAFINGWFRTGDMGYLDEEGYLYITGRKKELINKGGEKISPAEIDAVLMAHPFVTQAMAFRINDPVLGEDIAAMVVPTHGNVSENDLRKYLLDYLVQFKVPKRIYFVDEVPRGPTGKLLRYVGTDRYNHEHRNDTKKTDQPEEYRSSDQSLNQGILTQIWKDVLDIPYVLPDDDFFLCGGNSLAAIHLLIKIQRTFKINLLPDTIYYYPTIRQQALLVTQKATKTPRYHPLIVPIREDGTLPPLFCIHPLGGWMTHYTHLSSYINRNRPVFGIRARGLEPTETMPLTVEETVQEQVDAIKSVQKEGLYHLLGFSNGGTIAYELGCQLSERGDRVAYLGIIDMSAPAPEVRYFKTLTTILFPGRVLGKIPAFIEGTLKANPDSRLFLIVSKSVRFVFHGILFRSGSKSLPSSVSDAHFNANFDDKILASYPEESHSHMKTQLKASLTYLPHRFPGCVTLFSTGPDPILFPGDDTRGWGSYAAGKTVVIAVPGNHATLFDEPNFGILARRIDESLVPVDQRV